MTAPSISIAMATYNGAHFLRPQLESLAAQSVRPAEIVVTDDGSTDETRSIVESFAADAPFPVRFYANPGRLGFRGNFMRAAALCQGDLIAFSDQDDIWYPEKLATVAAVFESDPETLLVHHNAMILTPGGERTGPLAPAGRYPERSEPLTAHPWLVSHGFTQTFRRDLLDFQDLWLRSIDATGRLLRSIDATDPNERMSHDHWFLFLASVLGRIRWIEIPLADYRQHGSNTIGWQPENVLFRIRLWLEDRSDVFARCREAALRRAEIVEMLRVRLGNPVWQARVAAAGMRYWGLADLYDGRVQAYQGVGISSRVRAFRKLYAANAYNLRGDWTFYPKGACKDLALGVLAGPLLRRYGYPPFGGDPSCGAVAHASPMALEGGIGIGERLFPDPDACRAAVQAEPGPPSPYPATGPQGDQLTELRAGLRQRGSLTVWFTEKAVAARDTEPRTTRGP